MGRSVNRHQRQMRLPIIGREGQKALAELGAQVAATGDEGIVAARYLAGAGIGRLIVATPESADAARRLDATVSVEIGPALEPPPAMTELDDLDPAARAVARGARTAARILVAALGSGRSA